MDGLSEYVVCTLPEYGGVPTFEIKEFFSADIDELKEKIGRYVFYGRDEDGKPEDFNPNYKCDIEEVFFFQFKKAEKIDMSKFQKDFSDYHKKIKEEKERKEYERLKKKFEQ